MQIIFTEEDGVRSTYDQPSAFGLQANMLH